MPVIPDQERSSCPVDVEMLCVSWIIQSLVLFSEFRKYTVDFANTCSFSRQCSPTEGIRRLIQGARCWLERNLRQSETQVCKQELLPLPRSVDPTLGQQHMNVINDMFDEIKTQLQLMHAALDKLEHKEGRVGENFCRLEGLLKNIPTCRCETNQDRYCNLSLSATTISPRYYRNNTNARSKGRLVKLPMKMTAVNLNRLEVPIRDVVKPTAVQEHSSALLNRIVEAVDDGL